VGTETRIEIQRGIGSETGRGTGATTGAGTGTGGAGGTGADADGDRWGSEIGEEDILRRSTAHVVTRHSDSVRWPRFGV
jgi:hypothetical protein